MAHSIEIPELGGTIYINDVKLGRGFATPTFYWQFAEPPRYAVNIRELLTPYRGESDYDSGWIPIMTRDSIVIFIQLQYEADRDIGFFVCGYSLSINTDPAPNATIVFPYRFGQMQPYQDYVAFCMIRELTSGGYNPYSLYVTQFYGALGSGVWDPQDHSYDYDRTSIIKTFSEYYYEYGPWTQEPPITWPPVPEELPSTALMSNVQILTFAYRADYPQGWEAGISLGGAATWESIHNMQGGGVTPDAPNPDPNNNDPNGPSKPGGGDGDHQGHYDPIPIPGLPAIGPNSAGFVYMLRLQQTEMASFARNLLAPNWWNALKNFFADPMDFICGIMIVPYIPTSQHRVYPKFGENTFDTAFDQVYQQYTAIDCGTIAVNKYFGSCFDYNPYHRLLLWLPYIGYRELDPDEFVGKSIHVVYHCDCLTGDCVAFVSSIAGEGVAFERVVAQYSGNCGVRVPFGTQSFDSAIAASVQLLGGAVGLIAGGAGGAAIAAGEISASQIANSVAGSTIQAVNGGKIATERSGTAGATAGYLSVQKPYLLRTVMQQSLPDNYMNLEGYPSNIAGPLRLYSGFAGVETIDLNGIAATKDELDEITALLRGGVFI